MTHTNTESISTIYNFAITINFDYAATNKNMGGLYNIAAEKGSLETMGKKKKRQTKSI